MSGAALVGGVTGAKATGVKHEDRKKQRGLDEARKQGLLEPEKDAEGNPINPHVPGFMSEAPWYLAQTGPGLQHQKSTLGKTESAWDAKRDKYAAFDPGEYMTSVVGKYARQDEQRKLQRAADLRKKREQRRQTLARLRERRAERQAARRSKRAEAGDPDALSSSSSSEESEDEHGDEDDEDEDVRLHEVADPALGGTGLGIAGAKHTAGSLRQRENTAKYLFNLDPDSAFYEPGTRSMRENPNPGSATGTGAYRGDAELLEEGSEVTQLARTQIAAWEAFNRGQEVTLHGNPTAAERLRKQVEERKRTAAELRRGGIAKRYGDSAGPAAAALVGIGEVRAMPPPRHRPAARPKAAVESQPAVVSSPALPEAQAAELRKAIAHRAAAPSSSSSASAPRSRYDEDVTEGEHTAVWGSWFDVPSRSWGYACCRSCKRSPKCSGGAGILAQSLAARLRAAREKRLAGAARAEAEEAAARDEAAAAAAARSQAAHAAADEGDAAREGGAPVGEGVHDEEGVLRGGPSLLEVTARAVASGEHVPRPMSERAKPATASAAFGSGGDTGIGGGGSDDDEPGISLSRMRGALERRQAEQEGAVEKDERRRGFMSEAVRDDQEVTEEDVEAFRLTREQRADPMAQTAGLGEDEDVSAALREVRKRPRPDGRDGGRGGERRQRRR